MASRIVAAKGKASRKGSAPRSSNVIPFRRSSSVPRAQMELVELFNELAARAAGGELIGVMFVATHTYGSDEWGICGELTKDLDLAVDVAARAHVEALAHKAEQEGRPSWRTGRR